MLGKTKGRRRKGMTEDEMDSMDMNFSKLWEIVKDRGEGVLQCMGSQSQTRLSN